MSTRIIAEISLEKLKSNAHKSFALLKSGVKRCAVVKSNAYGHGLVEVASALYPHCDYYAVSLLDEVVKLRQSGIDKPIIILTPVFENTVDGLVRNNAIITVTKFSDVDLIEKSAKKQDKKVSVHLAINSGMNRLGFSSENKINNVIERIKQSEFVKIDGAFSHFADVSDKEFCEKQYQRFLKLSKPIKYYNKNAVLHLSASGGLLLDSDYQLDMVRVGILLYGYTPYKTDKIKVEPIMKVKANAILSRANVENEHLLYGNYICKHKRITLLRLGYADGFLRRGMKNSTNNLCMDICAVKGVKRGLVTVMDNAQELAEKTGTIAYEILVNVTARAKFVYKD